MKCANCGARKFFFVDGEELFPGSDIQFCTPCRKKVTPFLEERNTYPTHVSHLVAKKAELEEAGVTTSGLDALGAYCAYLDRITPKPQATSEEPLAQKPTAIAQVVPVKDVVEKIEAQTTQIGHLTQQVDHLEGRLKITLWTAIAGGATSLCSLLALLIMILGG